MNLNQCSPAFEVFCLSSSYKHSRSIGRLIHCFDPFSHNVAAAFFAGSPCRTNERLDQAVRGQATEFGLRSHPRKISLTQPQRTACCASRRCWFRFVPTHKFRSLVLQCCVLQYTSVYDKGQGVYLSPMR
jgi:hypothetical protein